MTWPLLTCFSWALLIWASVVDAATVTGHVSLIAGKEDRQGQTESSTTIVWLSPLASSTLETSPGHTNLRARMVQKNKHFDPHILVIQVGTSVDFPNFDPIFHNAFSNFDGQLFDIGLYPPGSSRSIRFHREGLVRVFCNIHPTMSAVIVVVSTPYYASTGKNGDFTLLNVPPGDYVLHFFQERSTPETLDALTRNVSVSAQANILGNIQISEAGYIPTPHKNKYGRDYPADNPGLYH